MFGYIFGGPKCMEVDSVYISTALRTQSALNCMFMGAIWLTLVYIKNQQYEIRKLTEKVKELKKGKGE